MILVMLKVYDDTTWGMWLFANKWWLVLFIALMFGLFIVIGYLDRKYIRPKEISEINKVNPELMEILKIVKDKQNEKNH